MKASILWIYLVVASLQSGNPFPTTMTKLVVRLESPSIAKDSFAALPKTFYRAGNQYCRIEELPDPDHGIHGLIIINEPDIWLVNRLTKTAQHRVDSGPTFNCRLPIFAMGKEMISALDSHDPLMGLEFGRELAYFLDRGAVADDGPVLQGKSTKAYTVVIGANRLFLFTTGAPERPLAVARQRGSVRDIYWYGNYVEMPFEKKLFAKPAEVKIDNIK